MISLRNFRGERERHFFEDLIIQGSLDNRLQRDMELRRPTFLRSFWKKKRMSIEISRRLIIMLIEPGKNREKIFGRVTRERERLSQNR